MVPALVGNERPGSFAATCQGQASRRARSRALVSPPEARSLTWHEQVASPGRHVREVGRGAGHRGVGHLKGDTLKRRVSIGPRADAAHIGLREGFRRFSAPGEVVRPARAYDACMPAPEATHRLCQCCEGAHVRPHRLLRVLAQGCAEGHRCSCGLVRGKGRTGAVETLAGCPDRRVAPLTPAIGC